MKVTIKGQVTIPAQVRKFLAIKPHDEVTFIFSGEQVILQKAHPTQALNRFTHLLGCRQTGHSTEELMREIRPHSFDKNDPGSLEKAPKL